jgi:NitT/TauT family transport system substrate-binding protein
MVDRRAFIFFSAIVLLVLAVVFSFQYGRDRRPGNSEKVVFAVGLQPVSAPVYVAHDKGFFEQEGLQVTLQHYWAGKDALESVMQGKADFCTVAETPIVLAALSQQPLSILATISDSKQYMKIVARKDRGIFRPDDLRTKRIGVSPGTNAEYYLATYLTFNGIRQDEVQVVPVKPEGMAAALADGDIDAAVSWEPHLGKQRKALGPNAVVLENRGLYQLYWNLVSSQEYVKSHRDTIGGLLRALLRAQQYMEEHEGEMMAITAAYVGEYNFKPSDFHFDLRLGQSLILSLEEQERWAIASGRAGANGMINFLRLVDFEGMEAVAPDSVTLH